MNISSLSADYTIKSPSAQDFSDMNEVADDENAAVNGDTKEEVLQISEGNSNSILNHNDSCNASQEVQIQNDETIILASQVNLGIDVCPANVKMDEEEVAPLKEPSSSVSVNSQPTGHESLQTYENIPKPLSTETLASEVSTPGETLVDCEPSNQLFALAAVESNISSSESIKTSPDPAPAFSEPDTEVATPSIPSVSSPDADLSQETTSVQNVEPTQFEDDIIEGKGSIEDQPPTVAPLLPVTQDEPPKSNVSEEICKTNQENCITSEHKDVQSSDNHECDSKKEVEPRLLDYDADDEGSGVKPADNALMPPPPVPDEKKSDKEEDEESDEARSKKHETPLASMLPSKYAGIDVTEIFPDFRVDKASISATK